MADPTTPPAPAPIQSPFVTVIAWLGIILFGSSVALIGADALVFRPFLEAGGMWTAAIDSLAQGTTPGTVKPPVEIMQYMFVGFLLYSGIGLAASIGLLGRRNWARLIIIGFLALNIFWSFFGLLGSGLSSNPRFSTPPPGFPSGEQMDEMFRMMRIFMAISSTGVALASGWLIYRLMSKPIRAEFGSFSP
jgi:hypothetical protein